MAAEFEKRTEIITHVLNHLNDVELDPAFSTAIFRIAQESLTNVARHADANTVQISLANKGMILYGIIEDDGIGIDPGASKNNPSLGIVGMIERSRSLGGQLEVVPRKRGGTRVCFEIPIQRKRNNTPRNVKFS